jgi:holo-[acyl-carrier protein] synthase
MIYTGIDLVEIERIAQAAARWGERFLSRVYTPAEQAACAARPESLAARWAAKEATAKALGVGVRGLGLGARGEEVAAVAWTEIEVVRDAAGRPALALHGRAAAHARALGIGALALSLSHTDSHAVASVVALAQRAGEAAQACP